MLVLEKFGPNDYDQLIGWIEDAKTLMQIAGPQYTYPLTREQLHDSLQDLNRYGYRFVEDNTGLVIGHAQILLTEKSIYLGRILVGDENQRGKGFGEQITRLLVNHGFRTFHRDQVELNVFDWNVSAIKCYEKCGFVSNHEKNFERTINGKTWTAVNMVLLRENYVVA